MAVLAPGGLLVFSTNAQRFKLDASLQDRYAIRDISKETLPQWAKQLKDWGFTDVPDKYLQQGAAGK